MPKKSTKEKPAAKPVLITNPEDLNNQDDIKKVRRSIADIQKGVDALMNKDGDVIVNNNETQEHAIAIRSRVRNGKSVIEKSIKYYTDPLKKIVKGMTALKNSLLEPLDDIDKALADGLLDYKKKLDEAAAKKERELQEKIRKDQEARDRKLEELKKQAEEAKTPEDQQKAVDKLNKEAAAPPVLPEDTHIERQEKVQTDSADITYKDNWKAEILDENTAKAALVKNGQLEYLKIDESALNRYAKIVKNTKQIPGIRFYNDKFIVQSDK